MIYKCSGSRPIAGAIVVLLMLLHRLLQLILPIELFSELLGSLGLGLELSELFRPCMDSSVPELLLGNR